MGETEGCGSSILVQPCTCGFSCVLVHAIILEAGRPQTERERERGGRENTPTQSVDKQDCTRKDWATGSLRWISSGRHMLNGLKARSAK